MVRMIIYIIEREIILIFVESPHRKRSKKLINPDINAILVVILVIILMKINFLRSANLAKILFE